MIPGYTTLEVIGRGAGSTIYKVKHQQTGKIFSLKQVKRLQDADGRFFEQVLTEHKAGRRISHPHVRQSYALHRVRKFFRVVEIRLLLEYVEGRTLEQARISEIGDLVKIFTWAAQGLRAMHLAGLVHADIKPNNVMLCEAMKVKLIDLGQACPLGKVKQRIQGTPDFIAPEQVLRLPLDETTDVFNLGATMYWCLTGKKFPTRIKSRQPAGAINLDSPRAVDTPQECNPEVPGVLSNLVMDCCRNSQHNRPRTMDKVLTRLEAVRRVQTMKRGGSPGAPPLDGA